MKNASLGSNSENDETAVSPKLKAARDNPLTHTADFEIALAEEALKRIQNFITGIRLYQNHPVHRAQTEGPVIWRSGTTLLRDYGSGDRAAPTILVIPSLINRFDILDLDPKQSFLRALASAGFRPLVVDWGVPGVCEERFTIDDYVVQRLIPLVEFIGQTVAPRFHLLGYCMGGLLALALAALKPVEIKTLALFATPWDFHKPDDATGKAFAALAKMHASEWDQAPPLPVDIIQGMFASLQPLQAMIKFASFATLDPNSVEARHFVVLEDWLNDGVPLAAPAAWQCLAKWYGDNQPARGLWSIANEAGQKITLLPAEIKIPTYVVVPSKDRIVPKESARPLAQLLPQASLHEPHSGHIGLMASPGAPQRVWAPFLIWLSDHRK